LTAQALLRRMTAPGFFGPWHHAICMSYYAIPCKLHGAIAAVST